MTYLPGSGFVDSGNSSTSTLLSAASFTGTGVDVSAYASVSVIVDTDVDGTLYMEWSSDNSNWDRSLSAPIDVAITAGGVHTASVVAQYFRVVYTNGSTGQSHFRLQTIIHSQPKQMTGVQGNEIVTKSNDVQLVRVVSGFTLDIPRGLHGDAESWHKFGSNPSVGTSFEDIWAEGGAYPWPTAAETIRIASGGNAADDAAGAGARSITVTGLDGNFEEVSEDITTAGASASSATTGTFIRILRAHVKDVGTYGDANTGNILVENTTSTNTLANIEAGLGQTQLSHFTVKANYTGYIVRMSAVVASSKPTELRFFQRQNADDATSAPFTGKRLLKRVPGLEGMTNIELQAPLTVPEKTDLWFEGAADTGTSEVSVTYDIILIKNDTAVDPQ